MTAVLIPLVAGAIAGVTIVWWVLATGVGAARVFERWVHGRR